MAPSLEIVVLSGIVYIGNILKKLLTSSVDNKFVHSTRSEGSSDVVSNRDTGIDVADDLSFTLAVLSAFTEKNNRDLLSHRK